MRAPSWVRQYLVMNNSPSLSLKQYGLVLRSIKTPVDYSRRRARAVRSCYCRRFCGIDGAALNCTCTRTRIRSF
ncbi:hypothetical protein CVS40_10345 [Lucilia cuprina]|nr:hypothetical protein CVS40_10345 [Lucilia cuprina]